MEGLNVVISIDDGDLGGPLVKIRVRRRTNPLIDEPSEESYTCPKGQADNQVLGEFVMPVIIIVECKGEKDGGNE